MKPDFIVPPLSFRDREALRSRGVSSQDVVRQCRLLRNPPPPPALLRPCSIGDGLERLTPFRRGDLVRLATSAVRAGRLSLFVPASGAASRLFVSLLQLDRFRKTGGPNTSALLLDRSHPFGLPAARFFSNLRRLALFENLKNVLASRGRDLSRLLALKDFDPVLDALFDPSGLDVARWPKALIPFHRQGRRVLTAFEEHLAESLAFGVRKAHFTVPQEYLSEFRRRGKKWVRLHVHRRGGRFRLTFSVQDPATDTLALEKGKGWVHASDGSLLLRPGGHGALLGNLERTRGDIVLVRNIDNVPVASFQAIGNTWRKAMVGRLIEAQTEAAVWIRGILKRDCSEDTLLGAEKFIQRTLGIHCRPLSFAKRRVQALALLNRPWRVCGMVPNTGDPGGGPYWVDGKAGPCRQIVEGSQLVKSQKKLLLRSTHFNPVDMVVGLKDVKGRPFKLERYSDPSQAIISNKHFEGREIQTFEHPGLWNGAMAYWNTIFVELPARIFHPVKTITDLLLSGHTVRV
ncbi:MAG: DUF4301 family protein [Elusimicrobia bacterium]|nr:DUF4301 family protein [Elusimicrobiota bacterium]